MNEENKNVTPETNPEKVENVQEAVAEETIEEVAITEEPAEEIAAETVAEEQKQKTGIKGFFKKIFNKKNFHI